MTIEPRAAWRNFVRSLANAVARITIDAIATASERTTYEERVDRDPRWALSEGSRHFESDSAVFRALERIAEPLDGIEKYNGL